MLGIEKFRILSFERYSRVMFMGYNTLPRCNTDYLFELSEPGIGHGTRLTSMLRRPSSSEPLLKENVVVGVHSTPPDGVLFLLKASKIKKMFKADRLKDGIHFHLIELFVSFAFDVTLDEF